MEGEPVSVGARTSATEAASPACVSRYCRRCSRIQSRIGLRVPSLPKLHGRGMLVTTKLCDTIHKSTSGHVFDLSNPKEYSSFTEYNSLHDPYLTSYFYRSDMKKKLIANKFITDDLQVICSLKEYNSYRNFLEMEFMKLRKREEEEKERERKEKAEKDGRKPQQSEANKQREEKRKKFFADQEKRLRAKQLHLQRMKHHEEMAKMKELEERRMERERNEIKWEAEREHRRLEKMQQEHMEMVRRSKMLRSGEDKGYLRVLHLYHIKQQERLRHMKELEERWQMYEDHAQQMREKEEKKRQEKKELKEKHMRKREKIFQLLQKRDEERKQTLMEENHLQIEALKEQADQLEKSRQEKKAHDVLEWKEKIHKQQEHWKHHVACQTAKKHVEDDLLVHSHPRVYSSQNYTPQSPSRRISASNSRASSTSGTSKSIDRPNVRFVSMPTVHVFDKPLLEEESSHDMESDEEVTSTSATAAASQSLEEIIDLEKFDKEKAVFSGTDVGSEEAVKEVVTDGFTTGSGLSEEGKSDSASTEPTSVSEAVSVNTPTPDIIKDVEQECIPTSVSDIPDSGEQTPDSGEHEKKPGSTTCDEDTGVPAQESDVSVVTIASDVVEKALKEAVERVATPVASPPFQ